MCTAITWHHGGFFCGRNMDLGYRFGESVVIIPRTFPLPFHRRPTLKTHLAMVAMASVVDGVPLLCDGANEAGLWVAGLNFPGYSRSHTTPASGSLSPYEVVAAVLASCATVEEARRFCCDLHLVDMPFRPDLPVPTLHWLIADKNGAIVVESTARGIEIFDNPVGVMTNSPGFDYHLTNLRNYLGCSPLPPYNGLCPTFPLRPLGCGAGMQGLPGDGSTTSRFVRAVFARGHATPGDTLVGNIQQVFHILESVAMVRGTVEDDKGVLEYTTYSACIDVERGVYYYKTYENPQVCAVFLHNSDLNCGKLTVFPLVQPGAILHRN